MSTPRFYVQIDRPDGSRTYKGPLPEARAQREADAWLASFPGVAAVLVPVAAAKADVRRWTKYIRAGLGYRTSEALPTTPTRSTTSP